MAAKYQLIMELYRRTGIVVAKNPQAWQSFLAAACRNYKCRFDEQLLIYSGTSRKMKCPYCGNKSYHKKVLTK